MSTETVNNEKKTVSLSWLARSGINVLFTPTKLAIDGNGWAWVYDSGPIKWDPIDNMWKQGSGSICRYQRLDDHPDFTLIGEHAIYDVINDLPF
jgi:hypothetical protein